MKRNKSGNGKALLNKVNIDFYAGVINKVISMQFQEKFRQKVNFLYF